jgi:hypothetical protein
MSGRVNHLQALDSVGDKRGGEISVIATTFCCQFELSLVTLNVAHDNVTLYGGNDICGEAGIGDIFILHN